MRRWDTLIKLYISSILSYINTIIRFITSGSNPIITILLLIMSISYMYQSSSPLDLCRNGLIPVTSSNVTTPKLQKSTYTIYCRAGNFGGV